MENYRRYPRPRALCVCPDCGEVFTKPESLEHHQAIRHAGNFNNLPFFFVILIYFFLHLSLLLCFVMLWACQFIASFKKLIVSQDEIE